VGLVLTTQQTKLTIAANMLASFQYLVAMPLNCLMSAKAFVLHQVAGLVGLHVHGRRAEPPAVRGRYGCLDAAIGQQAPDGFLS